MKKQSFSLINNPTGGLVPSEVAQRVYREAGGQPFLLQYLMSMLCDRGNLPELKVEDVLEACERFHRQRYDFDIWWEKLTAIDRKIYEVLCETRQASPEWPCPHDVVDTKSGQQRTTDINK